MSAASFSNASFSNSFEQKVLNPVAFVICVDIVAADDDDVDGIGISDVLFYEF